MGRLTTTTNQIKRLIGSMAFFLQKCVRTDIGLPWLIIQSAGIIRTEKGLSLPSRLMKNTSINWKSVLLVLVSVAALALLVQMQSPLPGHLTKIDYRAYWGASRLLANSENFSDEGRLLELQRQFTGWTEDEAMMTWNPPWLLGWFLPYAALTFNRSSWLWFLTNIFLIFTSVILLWRVFSNKQENQRKIWIPFLLTFIYVPTLTTLLVGQITSLVLFGLAGFLFYDQRRKQFASGVALALTTVKPHLVYVTLPLLLLELARQRRWRSFAGFLAPLLLGTLLVFLLRPTFVPEYIKSIGSGSLTRVTVPTITFVLTYVSGLSFLRFTGLLIIPVFIGAWYYRQRYNPIEMKDLVIVTLITSFLFTPVAWSFDAIILIIPLTRVAAWAVEGTIGRLSAVAMLIIFITANAIALYQRSLQVPDWNFFWFPTVMAGLYFWGWWQSSKSP